MPGAGFMDGLGNQFLSSTTLTGNEYRNIAGGVQFGFFENTQHAVGSGNYLLEGGTIFKRWNGSAFFDIP